MIDETISFVNQMQKDFLVFSPDHPYLIDPIGIPPVTGEIVFSFFSFSLQLCFSSIKLEEKFQRCNKKLSTFFDIFLHFKVMIV